MIFDNITNIKTYMRFSPFMERILTIIISIRDGRFNFENPLICNDGFKIIPIIKNIENCKTNYCLERHISNIDFHLIIDGSDDIGIRNIKNCKKIYKSYDAETDCELYNDEPEYRFKLLPGDFLIITPSHAHDTLLSKGYVKKIVFKMPQV